MCSTTKINFSTKLDIVQINNSRPYCPNIEAEDVGENENSMDTCSIDHTNMATEKINIEQEEKPKRRKKRTKKSKSGETIRSKVSQRNSDAVQPETDLDKRLGNSEDIREV